MRGRRGENLPAIPNDSIVGRVSHEDVISCLGDIPNRRSVGIVESGELQGEMRRLGIDDDVCMRVNIEMLDAHVVRYNRCSATSTAEENRQE